MWTYEQPEPTSTYLITLQIGMYETHTLAKAPVPRRAVLPDRLRSDFDHDFGRQPQMMKLFVKLFGPYPLANGYTVVVTDDRQLSDRARHVHVHDVAVAELGVLGK